MREHTEDRTLTADTGIEHESCVVVEPADYGWSELRCALAAKTHCSKTLDKLHVEYLTGNFYVGNIIMITTWNTGQSNMYY